MNSVVKTVVLLACLCTQITTVNAQNQWRILPNSLMDFNFSPPQVASFQSPDGYQNLATTVGFDFIQSMNSGQLETLGFTESSATGVFYTDGAFNALSLQVVNAKAYQIQNFYLDYYLSSTLAFNNGNSFRYITYTNPGKQRVVALAKTYKQGAQVYLEIIDSTQVLFQRSILANGEDGFYDIKTALNDTKSSLKVLIDAYDNTGVIQATQTLSLKGDLVPQIIVSANSERSFVVLAKNLQASGSLIGMFFGANEDGKFVLEKQQELYQVSSSQKASFEYTAAAFSPNDTLLYVSIGKKASGSLGGSAQGTLLKRVSFYETSLKVEDVSLPDSVLIDRITLGPNGKLYFKHHQSSSGDRSALGVLHYPDSDVEEIEPELLTLAVFNVGRRYDEGVHPQLFKGIELLRFKAQQKQCDQPYISTSNYSDMGFLTFEWQLFDTDTNLIASVGGSNPRVYPKESGMYLLRLKGTDGYGRVAWRWTKVAFTMPLQVSLPFEVDTLCQNSILDLTPAVVNTQGAPLTYRWNISANGGLPSIYQEKSIKHLLNVPGLYQLSLTVDDGYCPVRLELPYIPVISSPKAGFTLSRERTCTAQEVVLTDQSKGIATHVAYNWSDGMEFNERKGHKRSFDTAGRYKVTQYISVSSQCTSSHSEVIQVSQGLADDSTTRIISTTVISENAIAVSWNGISGIKGYELLRLDPLQKFQIYGDTVSSYIDTLPSEVGKVYTYQVKGIDSCETVSSTVRRKTETLYLEGVYNDTIDAVKLHWNKYKVDGVEPLSYQLECFKNNQWTLIDHVGNNTYLHQTQGEESIQYRVQVNQDSAPLHSVSNVVSLELGNQLFIPNAFSPNGDGINDVFSIGTFAEQEITCRVFAKGQLVAFSNDPAAIWNGRSVDGASFPVGTYTYILQVVFENGEELQQNGHIELIR